MIDELNDLFMEVKDAEPTYENLPEGEYLARLKSAEYKVSKSEKPMVQFTFEITDGEYKGKTHNKFMMLCGNDETQLKGNLTRYGNELKKYGIVATSLNDSFEQLKNLKDKDVKLTIKIVKEKYSNTTVEILE